MYRVGRKSSATTEFQLISLAEVIQVLKTSLFMAVT